MRNMCIFISIMFFFMACQSNEHQKNINSNLSSVENSSEVEKIRVTESSLEKLSDEQTKKLDGRIPPKIREILDNAEEITISYNIDENTTQLRVLLFETVPNAEAKISNSSTKEQFVRSFYSDAASNSNGAACFSPRHKIKAKYKTKIIEMDVCYECGNFRGQSSFGSFGGGLDEPSKSAQVISEIIKKYGKKIK